eukprot:scaffold1486_cov169-Ochromonas_danica.AAC.2
MPKLVELIWSNRQVTEKDVDGINIVGMDKVTKPKKERDPHQQHVVLLNKEDTVARFKLQKTKKEQETAAKEGDGYKGRPRGKQEKQRTMKSSSTSRVRESLQG